MITKSMSRVFPLSSHLMTTMPLLLRTRNNRMVAKEAKTPVAEKTQKVVVTAERAAYLAELHARPRELDRLPGATVQSEKSEVSSHFFVEQNSLEKTQLHSRLVSALQSHSGFQLSQPTVIQSKAIPAFTADNCQQHPHLHSEAGSGKTLAYLLPIPQSLAVDSVTGEMKTSQAKNRSDAGTLCIILCPTRELPSQTFQTVEKLCAASSN
jgi:hypothetical protein